MEGRGCVLGIARVGAHLRLCRTMPLYCIYVTAANANTTASAADTVGTTVTMTVTTATTITAVVTTVLAANVPLCLHCYC